MPDFPTREELAQRWRAGVVTTPGTRLSGKEIDRQGSDLNALQAAMTLMGEAVVTRIAQRFGASMESTAEGDDLDRVIFDRKQLPRKGRAPAVVDLVLQRAAATIGAGSVPAGTRVQVGRGAVYQLGLPVVFGALDLGPFTVRAECVTAGTEFEVSDNQSWGFLDAVFDTSIRITNPTAAAGASDGEPDDQYKARSRGFYRAARRGTMDAIVFGLQSTDGVALGSALEVLDPTTFLPASRVRCFAQDQIGRGNDGLAARAQVALLGYRAAGVPAIVEASTPVSTTVRIRGLLLDSRFAMDTDERVEAVRAAVVATGNGQVAGAALLRSTLIAAIKSVQGVIFEDTMLIEPAASVQPSSIYEVIRVDASDVIFEP